MNNLTLQADAFAARFENSTPLEVIETCRESLSTFGICEKEDNWKAYIKVRYGRKYIDGRPDIKTTEQLIQHAQAIEDNVEHDFTILLDTRAVEGVAYHGKICNIDDFIPEQCQSGTIMAHPNEDIGNYQSMFDNCYGKLKGLPITNTKQIFYVCVVETYLSLVDHEITCVLLASPVLCAEYAVQFLEQYEPYLIPDEITYDISQDPDEDQILEGTSDEIKDLLITLGETHEYIISRISFAGYQSILRRHQEDLNPEAKSFEISWFPVRFRSVLPTWRIKN